MIDRLAAGGRQPAEGKTEFAAPCKLLAASLLLRRSVRRFECSTVHENNESGVLRHSIFGIRHSP